MKITIGSIIGVVVIAGIALAANGDLLQGRLSRNSRVLPAYDETRVERPKREEKILPAYDETKYGDAAEPKCQELIPNVNNTDDDRINIVFVGHSFDNIQDLKNISEKIVDYNGTGQDIDVKWYINDLQKILGLVAIEPYKSNKEAFNFWYVDKSYNETQAEEVCPRDLTDYEKVCPLENQYVINVCNYHTSKGGQMSDNEVSMTIINEEGALDYTTIGLVNHELGGHAIGNLEDVAYPSSYGISDSPNLAGTIEDAINWWEDQLGDGCGQDGIVDCDENCYKDGTCGPDEYNTEVQYIAVKPEDCFQNNNPIDGCSLDLTRGTVPGGSGAVNYKHITFKAKSPNECNNSEDNCMYYEDQAIQCFDKQLNRLDTCENIVDTSIYPDFPNHHESQGAKYKPHLLSIMKGPTALKFGPVNEKAICERLKTILGSTGGICSSKYGIE